MTCGPPNIFYKSFLYDMYARSIIFIAILIFRTMADSAKGDEDKASRPASQAIVVASQPIMPPADGSSSDDADKAGKYSSPNDPCPSPKWRRKEDGQQDGADYVPLKKVVALPSSSFELLIHCLTEKY